jgi:hypothetical protein
MGYSCLEEPSTGLLLEYAIFNTTAWYHSPPRDYSCQFFEGVRFSDPSKLFVESHCVGHGDSDSGNACLEVFCACVSQCTGLCVTYSYQRAYLSFSIVFGIISLAAIALIFIYFTYLHPTRPSTFPMHPSSTDSEPGLQSISFGNTSRSRPHESRSRLRHLWTSLCHLDFAQWVSLPLLEGMALSFIRAVECNKLLRTFLPIWTLDLLSRLFFVCNVGLFVQNVIKPEFSLVNPGSHYIDCNKGVAVPHQPSDSWQCKSSAVTGFALAMLMMVGLLSCPFWFLLSRYAGKHKAWQVGSFTQAFLYLTLGFSIGEGLVSRTIGFCGLIGVGVGSWFLNDSILADIVDYHEFLTVTYCMYCTSPTRAEGALAGREEGGSLPGHAAAAAQALLGARDHRPLERTLLPRIQAPR